MKIFGGEIEISKSPVHQYFTDSGRSSLRLISKSVLAGKKVLVPDFLCQIVLDVFDQNKVKYSFYKIKEDLSIDYKSIQHRNFDAFYFIDYFGSLNKNVYKEIKKDVLFIEDGVFLPALFKPEGVKNWIGFNSFRKISGIADGSIVSSTKKLNKKLINNKEASFSSIKYEGKFLKYKYLNESNKRELKKESLYLRKLEQAECLLDKQNKIYEMSSISLLNLIAHNPSFLEEAKIRHKNVSVLEKYFKKISLIKFTTKDFPCSYAIKVPNRDLLKRQLFKCNVYLSSFWVNPRVLDNSLYQNMLCIPVDSRYMPSDLRKIAKLIKSKIG